MTNTRKTVTEKVKAPKSKTTTNFAKFPVCVKRSNSKKKGKEGKKNPLSRMKKSRVLEESVDSNDFDMENIISRQYSKRTSTNIRNDTTKLKRLKSDPRIGHRVIRMTENNNYHNKLSDFEFNAKNGETNFKARFKTKQLKKGGLKATFKGEIIVNKFSKKKKPSEKKKNESNKKLRRLNSKKSFKKIERDLFNSEIEQLKTYKDNLFTKPNIKIEAKPSKPENKRLTKKDRLHKFKSPVLNRKKKSLDSKRVLKKVKSVEHLECTKIDQTNDNYKDKKGFLRSMRQTNKNYVLTENIKQMAIVVNKGLKKKSLAKKVKMKSKSPVNIKKSMKKTKTGKIVINIKGKSKNKMVLKKNIAKKPRQELNKKKKVETKNTVQKTKRLKSKKKIRSKRKLTYKTDTDKNLNDYIDKVKLIQNWWRGMKMRKTKAIVRRKKSILKISVLSKESPKKKEEKDDTCKLALVQSVPKKEIKVPVNKNNDSLQNILELYQNIQNDQLNKWKGFFNKIAKIEQEKKSDNPILTKVKTDSIKAINFLMGKINKPDNPSDIFNEAPFNNSKNDSKQILNSFSIDNKNQERFLLPANKIKQRHIYDSFKDNYLNKSGKNSKSLISFKNGPDKSMKSISTLNINDDTESKGLLKFIKGNKVGEVKKFNYQETWLKTSINRKVMSRNYETAVDFVYEHLIEDIITDSQFNKLFKRKGVSPGVNISIMTIHQNLNDISENIIFNYLQSLKDNLNYHFSFNLEKVLKRRGKKDKTKTRATLTDSFYDQIKDTLVSQKYEFKSQKSIVEVFNRCLYDSLNEAVEQSINVYLLCQLPYSNKIFFTERDSDDDYLDDISAITCLEKACNMVLSWNDTMCGLLINDVKINKDCNEHEYINQIREECMDKFIMDYIKTEKESWMVKREEMGELALEISDQIENSLFSDLASFLTDCLS